MATITKADPSSATSNRQTAPLPSVPANGPAAAALLAAGLGSATLGLAVVLVEASPHGFKNWLNFYDPVGPLSGKTIVATAVYLISWIVLVLALRGKNVRLGRWVIASFVLVGVGVLLTFPPVYQLFTRK